MKTRETLAIGDPVEIRVTFKAKSGTWRERWLPATVIGRNAMQIMVQLANHEQVSIPIHKTEDYRVPAVTELPTKWGTFTLAMMQELKAAHEKAVAAGEARFDCLDHPWNTGFVGYLLEYAREEGMKL